MSTNAPAQPGQLQVIAAASSGVIKGIDGEKLLDCVHCGICLSVCPTYDLLGTEADSPRGRIYLMRAVAEGRVELSPEIAAHFDSCLGCRACETACPSAVPYGEFLAHFRDAIERTVPRPVQAQRARRTLLDLLSSPTRLAPLMFGARLAGKLFGSSGGPVAAVGRFLFGPKAPQLPVPEAAALSVRRLPSLIPARGERRARVAFLAGCVMQVLFEGVNRATVEVLAENGCDVWVPQGDPCCGAFHLHNGEVQGARERARPLIRALEAGEYDVLVTNSAGCGSSLKEYGELFHGDPEWEARALRVVERARDVSEYLMELGPRPPRGLPRPRRVAYHDACHLAHGQQVRSQPRDLLRMIPGVELVEIQQADWCCGSAGIYNFLQPDLAGQLQERKVDYVLAAKPDTLVTGNPGCHSWIQAGLRARGAEVEVRHTLELLAEGYGLT